MRLKKTIMKVKLSESISERELSRRDWVLVSYDDANKSEKWKWPENEDKIIYKRSQIFEKLNLPEVASCWGQFIFKDITLRIWVCIIFVCFINCSRSVLLIQKSIQFEYKYCNNTLRSKNRLTGKFVVIVYCCWI